MISFVKVYSLSFTLCARFFSFTCLASQWNTFDEREREREKASERNKNGTEVKCTESTREKLVVLWLERKKNLRAFVQLKLTMTIGDLHFYQSHTQDWSSQSIAVREGGREAKKVERGEKSSYSNATSSQIGIFMIIATARREMLKHQCHCNRGIFYLL